MIDGHTFEKKSYVKCHLISGYTERDVNRKLGSIKEKYFNEIVDKTIESIFWKISSLDSACAVYFHVSSLLLA